MTSRPNRRERVPQVMQVEVRQLRQLADLAPGLLQVDQMLAPALARHHGGMPSATPIGSFRTGSRACRDLLHPCSTV
jgi:hypothetical protein